MFDKKIQRLASAVILGWRLDGFYFVKIVDRKFTTLKEQPDRPYYTLDDGRLHELICASIASGAEYEAAFPYLEFDEQFGSQFVHKLVVGSTSNEFNENLQAELGSDGVVIGESFRHIRGLTFGVQKGYTFESFMVLIRVPIHNEEATFKLKSAQVDEDEELSESETNQQDFVDNQIHILLCRLADKELEWDIHCISKVRNTIQDVLCGDLKVLTEQEFYPYRELEDDAQS